MILALTCSSMKFPKSSCSFCLAPNEASLGWSQWGRGGQVLRTLRNSNPHFSRKRRVRTGSKVGPWSLFWRMKKFCVSREHLRTSTQESFCQVRWAHRSKLEAMMCLEDLAVFSFHPTLPAICYLVVLMFFCVTDSRIGKCCGDAPRRPTPILLLP